MNHAELMQCFRTVQSLLDSDPSFIGADQQLHSKRKDVISAEIDLSRLIMFYPDLQAIVFRSGIETRSEIKDSLKSHVFNARDESEMKQVLAHNSDIYFYVYDDKLGHTYIAILTYQTFTLLLLHIRIADARNCDELKDVIFSFGDRKYRDIMHHLAKEDRVFYINNRFKYLPHSRRTGQAKVYQPYPLHKAKIKLLDITRKYLF